jgi:predicted  nucleic acid-binding Zn-ribbon protein
MNMQSALQDVRRLLDHSDRLQRRSEQLQDEANKMNDYLTVLSIEQEKLKEHIDALTRGVEEQRRLISLLLDADPK